jgi:hypothetical protein
MPAKAGIQWRWPRKHLQGLSKIVGHRHALRCGEVGPRVTPEGIKPNAEFVD